MEWFIEFHDSLYREVYGAKISEEETRRQAEFVMDVLGLSATDKVLDVACGYGRHMKYLSTYSYVVGVDINLEFLREAKSWGDVVAGDMRALPFRPMSFTGIYVMFSSFGFFNDHENEESLREMAYVLKAGGRILLDLINREPIVLQLSLASSRTLRYWSGAGPYTLIAESYLDLATGRLHEERIIMREWKTVARRRLDIRLYSLSEVYSMFRRAGLVMERVYGDYAVDSPYLASSPRMIVLGVKYF